MLKLKKIFRKNYDRKVNFKLGPALIEIIFHKDLIGLKDFAYTVSGRIYSTFLLNVRKYYVKINKFTKKKIRRK